MQSLTSYRKITEFTSGCHLAVLFLTSASIISPSPIFCPQTRNAMWLSAFGAQQSPSAAMTTFQRSQLPEVPSEWLGSSHTVRSDCSDSALLGKMTDDGSALVNGPRPPTMQRAAKEALPLIVGSLAPRYGRERVLAGPALALVRRCDCERRGITKRV